MKKRQISFGNIVADTKWGRILIWLFCFLTEEDYRRSIRMNIVDIMRRIGCECNIGVYAAFTD